MMMIVMGVMNHHWWWWWWWWAIEKALTKVQSLALPPKTIPNTATTCQYCFLTSSLLKRYTWNHDVFHCHQFINPPFQGFKTFGRNWAADVWFGRASHSTNGFSHTHAHTFPLAHCTIQTWISLQCSWLITLTSILEYHGVNGRLCSKMQLAFCRFELGFNCVLI